MQLVMGLRSFFSKPQLPSQTQGQSKILDTEKSTGELDSLDYFIKSLKGALLKPRICSKAAVLAGKKRKHS
jgi:hypothetical protein